MQGLIEVLVAESTSDGWCCVVPIEGDETIKLTAEDPELEEVASASMRYHWHDVSAKLALVRKVGLSTKKSTTI